MIGRRFSKLKATYLNFRAFTGICYVLQEEGEMVTNFSAEADFWPKLDKGELFSFVYPLAIRRPFPLAPALSRRERVNRSQSLEKPDDVCTRATGYGSLSLMERAG